MSESMTLEQTAELLGLAIKVVGPLYDRLLDDRLKNLTTQANLLPATVVKLELTTAAFNAFVRALNTDNDEEYRHLVLMLARDMGKAIPGSREHAVLTTIHQMLAEVEKK